MKEYIYQIVFVLFWWCVLGISMYKDRSRYRNTAFLALALLNSFSLLLIPLRSGSVAAVFILFLAAMLLIMMAPFMLIANGVVMIRREGHSLANILSLLLGIVVLLGEVSLALTVTMPYFMSDKAYSHVWSGLPAFLMVIGVSVIYGSVVFAAFAIYTLFLQVIPVKRDFDYVIIHGSGLINGSRVSKLLSDRIDKAIEIYRKDPTPPILIPSGGKGSDEAVAEADAMADYMLEKGIPEDHIIRENRSVNTFENLTNCKEIIDSRPGRKYVALVTSNYHVYRALRYCRRIGLKCTGVGAHVAMYFWPSALIREFVAIHREKKHMLLFTAGWAIVILPFVLMYLLQ